MQFDGKPPLDPPPDPPSCNPNPLPHNPNPSLPPLSPPSPPHPLPPPLTFKEIKYQISKMLSILLNNFLTIGKIPSDWKPTKVTPVFKEREQVTTRQ